MTGAVSVRERVATSGRLAATSEKALRRLAAGDWECEAAAVLTELGVMAGRVAFELSIVDRDLSMNEQAA